MEHKCRGAPYCTIKKTAGTKLAPPGKRTVVFPDRLHEPLLSRSSSDKSKKSEYNRGTHFVREARKVWVAERAANSENENETKKVVPDPFRNSVTPLTQVTFCPSMVLIL
jgi:hypothetical protein